MIKKVLASAIMFGAAVMANAGYGEINSVGDVRQQKDVTNVYSTVTDSPMWKEVSKKSPYYMVSDTAEAEEAQAKAENEAAAKALKEKRALKEAKAAEKRALKEAKAAEKRALKEAKAAEKCVEQGVNCSKPNKA